MSDLIKVFLVDDHLLFREGLKKLLPLSKKIVVTGEASDGSEFLAGINSVEFDVVLMDINMPVVDGVEATEKLISMYPDAKVTTLSMFGDREYYFRMVSAGVKGFLLKNSDINEVITAIETVYQGGTYFSEVLLNSLVESLKSTEETTKDCSALSARETEILLLICKGLSNNEIGDKLFISKRTVDKHRANILAKTNCKNTANLVVYAIKNELVEI